MDRHESSKKRKLAHDGSSLDTAKPTAFYNPAPNGRSWTVSIAIPSSILADCSTADQRMVSPGRIARACAVFCVDELIVYDDSPPNEQARQYRQENRDPRLYTGDLDPCHFLAHVFSYLETPPFMRKALFPLHPNLRLAGLLPSLDMPHHPHMRDQLPYREGFTTTEKPTSGKGTLVDVGLNDLVHVPDSIPPRTRVTLHFPSASPQNAEAVNPTQPRAEGGYYWGYNVRRCSSLSTVFTESPFEEGYDVSIGTSERGAPASKAFPHNAKPPSFEHLLVVFGGPRGLEWASVNDPDLSRQGISGGKIRELFDHWVNVLPNQGSRTIRTDEAVYIALTALRRLWDDSS